MERRNEGSFEANSCCGWDFSVVVEGSSPLNNHNTHWTLTFGNYSQKECAGDRLGWCSHPACVHSQLEGSILKELDLLLQENLCQSYHYIIYHIISGQRTGMAIAEAWFCAQWPIFVFVFEVCVWIIVRLEDPKMAHYKISNGVSHLLIFICRYLIESMMPCV